jgi:outer membrane protein assembly factor BamB
VSSRWIAIVGLTVWASAVSASSYRLVPDPLWSAEVPAGVPSDGAYQNTGVFAADDGRLLGLSVGGSRVHATTLIAADGSVAQGLFGDPSGSVDAYELAVIAMSPDSALLRLSGTSYDDSPEAETALIDPSTGAVRWAIRRAANSASFLAGGDVLLMSGAAVARLDAATGVFKWARSAREFAPGSGNARLVSMKASAGVVWLAVQPERYIEGAAVATAPRLVALSTTTGDLLGNVAQPGGGSSVCATAVVAGGVASVQRGTVNNLLVDLTVVRLLEPDGTPGATTTIAAVPGDDVDCQLLAIGGDLVVRTIDDRGEGVLAAVDASGALRWRVDAVPGEAMALARVATGTDVITLLRPRAINGDVQPLKLERRRLLDGLLVWTADIVRLDDGRRSVMAAPGSSVVIATATAAGIERIVLDAATGVEQARTVVAPRFLSSVVASSRLIGEQPFQAWIEPAGMDSTVRMRSLSAVDGAPLWSSAVAGIPGPAIPSSVVLNAAGTARVLAIATYAITPGTGVLRAVSVAFDRASGQVLWRREDGPSYAAPSLLHADDGGLLLLDGTCATVECTPGNSRLSRWEIADGTTRWAQAAAVNGALLVGDDAIASIADFPTLREFRRLAGTNGVALWTVPTPLSRIATNLQTAGSDAFLSVQGTSSTSPPRIDIETRNASDGSLRWSVRAGGDLDSVSAGLIARAATGEWLMTSRLVRLDAPAGSGISTLIQWIDPPTGTIRTETRPSTVRTVEWRQRPLPGGVVPTRQPLRSYRALESSFNASSELIGLAHYDSDTAEFGGEYLIERNYYGPLNEFATVQLLRERADGTIDIAYRPLDARGIRHSVIARLPAPGAARGDVRIGPSESPVVVAGLGPSRQVEIEVTNDGPFAVNGLRIGVAAQPQRPAPLVRIVGCSSVVGVASCPAVSPTQPELVLDLGADATALVSIELFDPWYSARARFNFENFGMARIYVDPPYGFADLELGNNSMLLQVRLGGFADDFE